MHTSDSSPERTPAARTPALLVVGALLLVAPLSGHALAEDAGTWVQSGRVSMPSEEPVKVSFCLVPIDPICGSSQTNFGAAVALDDDLLVIGNPHENQVHVYQRTGQMWLEVQTLSGEGRFGTAVDLEGETLVIGAPDVSEAMVWTRDGEEWVQEAAFTGEGCLGWGVTISGGRAGLGDSCADRIHVVERVDGLWAETAALEVDGAEALGHFLDSSGDRIVAASRMGVLVFEFTGGGWETTQVTSGSPRALGISGDTLAISVLGLVTVYEWDGQQWYQEAELRHQDVSPFDVFDEYGHSLAIEGDTLVVGAPRDDSSPGHIHLDPNGPPPCLSQTGIRFCIPPHTGSAYVFERGEDGWAQKTKLVADQIGDGRFGTTVAVHPGQATIAVGTPYKLASGLAGFFDVDLEDSVHLFTRAKV